MIKKILFGFNVIIFGSLILTFEHIGRHQFFGFLYPWLSLIFIFFIIYFSFTMPYYYKKPKGLYVLLTGLLFIFMHLILSSQEHFRTSIIFLSFIIIITLVVQNSDHHKLKIFLRIITYCCLINLIFAIYSIFIGTNQLGPTFRIGGLDQAPVLFGYNMLLGFWLVLINSIIEPKKNKSNTKLDKYFALAFVFGILLSKSMGAFFGLIMGLFAVIFVLAQRKIIINIFLNLIIFCLLIIFLYYLFPSLFKDIFILGRLEEKAVAISKSEEARFEMWADMLKSYFDQLSFFKLLFGGGQGFGNSLISRGVHSDHLKLFFDFGIFGLLIYYFRLLSCLKLINKFNVFVVGFVISAFASGIFYVNFGSITNSFSYILSLIVLSNYEKIKKV